MGQKLSSKDLIDALADADEFHLIDKSDLSGGANGTSKRATYTKLKAYLDTYYGSGTGDMLKSVYDPTTVNGDAFDMDNMIEGTTTKILTDAERTKLSGIATNANNYSHPNHTGDVTSTGDGATVIVDEAVTNAKLAHVASSTIKGRKTASTGDVEDLTITQTKQLLDDRLEEATISTTYALDYSLYETWLLVMSAATTLTESNLPTSGTNSKVITIHITGDYAITYPSGWSDQITGAYDASNTTAATGTITCASGVATDTVTVNGLVYTAVSGVKADNTQFSIDTSDTATATDLADSITNDVRSGTAGDTTATSSVGVVTITSDLSGVAGNAVTLASSNGTRFAVSSSTFSGGLDALFNTITVEFIKTAEYKVTITQPD